MLRIYVDLEEVLTLLQENYKWYKRQWKKTVKGTLIGNSNFYEQPRVKRGPLLGPRNLISAVCG